MIGVLEDGGVEFVLFLCLNTFFITYTCKLIQLMLPAGMNISFNSLPNIDVAFFVAATVLSPLHIKQSVLVLIDVEN